MLNTLISRACIVNAVLLVSAGTVAQNMTLTLSAAPPTPGLISTRNTNDQTMLVLSGHTVSLARASGSDYRLEARGGFYWTQVQEVPRDSESLEISPILREDGTIEVSLHVMHKNGTQMRHYSTTLVAQPGEWTQILGPVEDAKRGVRTYGTKKANAESLYLRIQP